MNRHSQDWHRLASAARTAGAEPEAAPYGFATRLAALGLAAPAANPWALLEKFALRGLLAAGLFSLAAIAFGYSAWAGDHGDDTVAAADTISDVLDIS
ncbi:MAG: hypothetical protein ACHQ5A_02600 [Opitutales bacterium]